MQEPELRWRGERGGGALGALGLHSSTCNLSAANRHQGVGGYLQKVVVGPRTHERKAESFGRMVDGGGVERATPERIAAEKKPKKHP